MFSSTSGVVRRSPVLLLCLILAACSSEPATAPSDAIVAAKGGRNAPPPPPPNATVQLGQLLFEDRNLSRTGNQSCQSCHEAGFGFAGSATQPTIDHTFFAGDDLERFGSRKPPSAAYASFSPVFHRDPLEGEWRGGNFWDGRATGALLGSPLADQALGPFLSSVEQALPAAACVVWKVQQSGYAPLFQQVYPTIALADIVFPADIATQCLSLTTISFKMSTNTRNQVQESFYNVARAIAAYESSPLVNKFSSRFDANALSATATAGKALFDGKAGCTFCHSSDTGPETFTDHSYYNIGVPRNPLNPSGPDWVDPGLGGSAASNFDPAVLGAFKTPTLRNVALGSGRTYMHNGSLKTLKQVVHFYNTRDSRRCRPGVTGQPLPTSFRSKGCWPVPDHLATLVAGDQMGNLLLTDTEENQLVVYLQELNDGFIR